MALIAIFWLVGLGCLIAALAGKGVKIGSVELPAFSAKSTRLGASVLGIVALLLGGVILAVQRQDGTGSVAAQGSTQGSTPRGTRPPASAPTGITVMGSATIRLASGSGVDVGDPVPLVQQSFLDTSFYFYDGYLKSSQDNGLAEWTADAAPNAQDCANQLRTQPIAQLQPKQGLRFCSVGYQHRRVAYLQIASYDDSSSTAQIDVVLWSLSAS